MDDTTDPSYRDEKKGGRTLCGIDEIPTIGHNQMRVWAEYEN
jgi:hypothetical protein